MEPNQWESREGRWGKKKNNFMPNFYAVLLISCCGEIILFWDEIHQATFHFHLKITGQKLRNLIETFLILFFVFVLSKKR